MPPASDRLQRVTVGPEPVAMVLGAVALALAGFAVAGAARRILGWALACVVVAIVLDPLVRVLSRSIPRALAIVIVLLGATAIGVAIGVGVLEDLGNQFDRLRSDLPRAAATLEAKGGLAEDLRVAERVDELLADLQDPRRGLAASAPGKVSAYFVCGILTIFFLASGPKIGRAALDQIADPSMRAQVRLVVGRGLRRGRVYVLASLAKAVAAGLIAGGVCWAEGVPAPIVLGAAAGIASVIPGLGIFLAGIPALVLEAGLGTAAGFGLLLAVYVALQVADAVVVRKVISPRSLVVGPAAVVIALVVGFEVYGLGGALYGAALAVFVVAALDAAGRLSELAAATASGTSGSSAVASAAESGESRRMIPQQ